MTIEDLGYTKHLETLRIKNNLGDFGIGRVIAEHRERYIVKNGKGEFEAVITGNLRFSANSREDFPAVGDWVALIDHDSDFVIIHSVFPRLSTLARQAVGKLGERQVIATNIDHALILQAVDRDFNINRIERYLTLCNSSGIKAILLLNKIDLISRKSLERLIGVTQERINQVPIIPMSNVSHEGIAVLNTYLQKGKTFCLLGSSGVGKSSLINILVGEEVMATGEISRSIDRGRHITTHRELLVTEKGIFIDNPGMREVGIADSAHGLDVTFETITALSKNCRFKDCTHTTEIGCAITAAVEKGEIDRSSYENYLKMEREKDHFESTLAERRKKEKDFGKMIKNYKKDRKLKKY
ncbi:ribosome small subunit-dependent GTPase A [Muricauda sp. SCSIO 64092]|uniref:ribosome small subunit-dependent GTPase A n=1 Tax=Allomuricauda sp. SCSIO 64092 TaxID=2908842 RepID=UPI001FF299AD|nr:ribosome small subunit-dependent GTPase A [Muricauda sp. SCSIO 64092]UOY06134.1 ribosome small subunit-dependent GTPase A [Muricauda sp. SCSIO 64092]